MNSFKLKLVVYFVLLSLLPMAAAFWGFTTVAGESTTRQVDARLQAGLRAAVASYQERLDEAQAAASQLARQRAFQIDLERRDRAGIARFLRRTPELYVVAGNGFRVGRIPALAASRRVDVITGGGLVGSVIAPVPLDATLVRSLRARAALSSADALAVIAAGRIVASAPVVHGSVRLPPGRTDTVRVDRVRYRVLLAPELVGLADVRFGVLSLQSRIDAAEAATRDRLVLGLLACLLLISFVAYLEGRSIVRTLRELAHAAHGIAHGRFSQRVPVRGRDEFALLGTTFNEMAAQLEARQAELDAERARLRDATARFGEALAATHDADQLLRVIVEAAVEATGAAGARLAAAWGAVVETGEPDRGGDRLEVPLATADHTFGRLALVGDAFTDEQRATALSLASHAAIALENARLHRIVERQALVDGLTGVANRRQCEEALHTEVARADRLGTPLTLVLADLDDFKAVNDLHGHGAGDEVLRAFASILRETVRESDLAGRWGGEEFMLLLPGADGAGGAQFAERVRTALAERELVAPDGIPLRVTCSFGVAQHAAGTDADALFAAADRALYRAKREGKDRVELEPTAGLARP